MKDLQKATHSTPDYQSDEEKIEHLCEAFTLFSHETERLENPYPSLKEELKQVYNDLQNSNQQLQNKAAELDVITDHLQALADRTDRMKLLGEMAAQVAHEIRNPLGGIKGFASLLKRDLADHPQMEQMADYIIEGTDNLNRLVGQILHYARPLQPHLEKVDLIAVLKELKLHIAADESINRHNITLAIDTAFEELFLSLDPSLFKAAMLNLIVNAAQAMPDGGALSICIQKKFGHAVLTITDTGIGISEENLAKIFSPFFTTKSEGNGLGLAETQKIIQAHKGTIEVASTVGKGTTFIIKLPLR